jgi:hypothetical protein
MLSDQWSLATGEDQGRPLIYRIRFQHPAFANNAAFPHLMVIFWAYESSNDQGMPIPEDVQRMSELENLLQPALEGASEGFLSVIVIGDGVREWQWYVRDPKRTMDLVNITLGHLEPFPVRFDFEDDPKWKLYYRFRDIGGSGDVTGSGLGI